MSIVVTVAFLSLVTGAIWDFGWIKKWENLAICYVGFSVSLVWIFGTTAASLRLDRIREVVQENQDRIQERTKEILDDFLKDV